MKINMIEILLVGWLAFILIVMFLTAYIIGYNYAVLKEKGISNEILSNYFILGYATFSFLSILQLLVFIFLIDVKYDIKRRGVDEK